MLPWTRKTATPDLADLDPAYLRRLAGHIGQAETLELLADGMLDLADRLDRVPALVSAGDATGLGDLLHEVAGAAGHLGLTALSAQAVAGQQALRSDATPDLAAIAEAVMAKRQPALDAVRAYCQAGGEVPE